MHAGEVGPDRPQRTPTHQAGEARRGRWHVSNAARNAGSSLNGNARVMINKIEAREKWFDYSPTIRVNGKPAPPYAAMNSAVCIGSARAA